MRGRHTRRSRHRSRLPRDISGPLAGKLQERGFSMLQERLESDTYCVPFYRGEKDYQIRIQLHEKGTMNSVTLTLLDGEKNKLHKKKREERRGYAAIFDSMIEEAMEKLATSSSPSPSIYGASESPQQQGRTFHR